MSGMEECARMPGATVLPTVVVRPSGVWNTRAPLHLFLQRMHEIQRDYCLLTLAVSRTRYDAEHRAPGVGPSAANFMRKRVSGPVASKAWNGYRDSWRRTHGSPDGQPSIEELEQDLGLALYPIREQSVVKVASVFETFVQSWALNMILATLEAGFALSPAEEKLAEHFSPVHTPGSYPPGVPTILKTFGAVQADLEGNPHVRTEPATGATLQEPITPILNSYRAILFWRGFRNQFVHSEGLVSKGFRHRHGAFFEAMREPYKEVLRPLEPMIRLQLPSVVFYAMVSVHYRAAGFLNKKLQEISRGRRGTIYAVESGVEEPVQFDPSLITRPMLIDGDHADSARWLKDETFRGKLTAEIADERESRRS